MPPTFFSSSTPLLLSCAPDELVLVIPAQHTPHVVLNLNLDDDNEIEWSADMVSQVVEFAKAHNLSSLSLPLPSPSEEEYEEPIHRLLRPCKTCNVEVLWYDPIRLEQYQVSPSFWRYAKELKAKQAAKEEGGQT
ncbi:hypothetical protein JCM8547_007010 [Rhodosporidiobolus lusitaniae]